MENYSMIVIYIIQCVMVMIPLFVGIRGLIRTILNKDKEHTEHSFFIQNNDDEYFF